MSTFTRDDAIRIVAERTKQTNYLTKEIIDTLVDEIQKRLAAGTRVEFRGFGIWEVKISKPRIGRNPAKPEEGSFQIPARPNVRFRTGTKLKALIEQNIKPAQS
jgi:nucleoid DNA-binding protein